MAAHTPSHDENSNFHLGYGETSTSSGALVGADCALHCLIELVRDLSQADLNQAKDLRQISTASSAAARMLAGADASAIILQEGENCFYAEEDSRQQLWKGRRVPSIDCIGGWAIHHRIAVSIPDIYEDPRIEAGFYRQTDVKSLAIVPIGSQQPLAALGVYWFEHHQTSPDQLRLLQAVADCAAFAMEKLRLQAEMEDLVRLRTEELESANRELRNEAVLRTQMEAKILRLSLTDELTSLNNRRGFLLRSEQILKLIHRMNTHGWLIYADIDNLKQVNDRFGHEAGDRLIRSAGDILRESFRNSDVIGRLGGDEFAVFATGTSAPIAEIEERLRRNIQRHNQTYANRPPIAMSVGSVRCEAQSTLTLDEMLKLADASMYQEKRGKHAGKTRQASE